jgi:hypoxanthine phosphoribosyltransferase
MPDLIEKVIIDENQIRLRVVELVKAISRDVAEEELVIVGILKGSFIFLADLIRQMYVHNLRPQVDFMILASYGNSTEPSTMLKIERDISVPVEGKYVLIVDDILDTGRTLLYVKERLKWLEPKIVKACVMLDKPARRRVKVEADYIGFKVEDKFVVGYGLDYQGYCREKPYVAVLEENSLK